MEKVQWAKRFRDIGLLPKNGNWHFSGHVQPRNKGLYTRWARATIQFSITCRDMDEFDEVFRGLKAAADALAETLYGKKT